MLAVGHRATAEHGGSWRWSARGALAEVSNDGEHPDAAAVFVRRFQRRGSGCHSNLAERLLTIARNVSTNMLPAWRFDQIDPEGLLAPRGEATTRGRAEPRCQSPGTPSGGSRTL